MGASRGKRRQRQDGVSNAECTSAWVAGHEAATGEDRRLPPAFRRLLCR